jgi:hypothetical protein
MKFMVLCLFELASTDTRDRQTAIECLDATGLKAVGHEAVGDGSCFGLANAAMGEFRAPTAGILKRRIEADLRLSFERCKLDARTTVCIVASHPLTGARDDVAV